MALSREVKVGLLALAAGTILYVGFNFLKGVDFFSPTKKYFVLYDNVEGLTASNPVNLNGLSVGQVDKIKILTNRNNKILVILSIDDRLVLGDSSMAVLSSTTLLGGKSIELKLGKNNKIYNGNDTLVGFKEQAISEMISEKALPIMSNLDSTVIKLNALFGDEMGLSVKTTMHNFELASHELNMMIAENRANFSQVSKNLTTLSASLKETEKSVKPLLEKMTSFADSLNDMQLKTMVSKANESMKNLEEITSKINKSEGSLGSLVNDKALYNNLNTSINDLDKLFLDVQKNPKRYIHFSVFGGKSKDEKKSKKKDQQSSSSAAPAVVNP